MKKLILITLSFMLILVLAACDQAPIISVETTDHTGNTADTTMEITVDTTDSAEDTADGTV